MECCIARTDREILECLPVLRELRPNLRADDFLSRIERQARHGFFLVFLFESNNVKAVAGCRISECLGCGKYLYIDDFVTTAKSQRQGYGEALMKWIIEEATQQRCTHLMLDSALHREASHALYRKLGMKESCLHFDLELGKFRS